jgi:hypothetical protein
MIRLIPKDERKVRIDKISSEIDESNINLSFEELLKIQKKKMEEKEKIVEILIAKKDGSFEKEKTSTPDVLSGNKHRESIFFENNIVDEDSEEYINKNPGYLPSLLPDRTKSRTFSSQSQNSLKTFDIEEYSVVDIGRNTSNNSRRKSSKNIRVGSKNNTPINYPPCGSYSSNNQSQITAFSYRFFIRN